jgi:TPR repeat protein
VKRAFVVIALLFLVGSTALAQSIDDFKKLDATFGPTHLAEVEKSAEAGDVDAQGMLGAYYSNGIRVSQDKRLAEYWYLKAAKQGHEDAQYNLGQMYRNGDTGHLDFVAALYWYERAAESGVVYAPSNIAGMYYEGMGVPPNPVIAAKWLIIAQQFGDERASSSLAIHRRDLSVAEYARADQLAREWLNIHRKAR